MDKKISALEIKKLREETGYSLSDCKKVLEQTGNFQDALTLLRRKYATKYENLIEEDIDSQEVVGFYRYPDNSFGYCQFLCKSDVVARSTHLQELINILFQILPSNLSPEETLSFCQLDSNFQNKLDEMLAYFREPIKLVVAKKRSLTETDVLAYYSHQVYHSEADMQISQRGACIVLSSPILPERKEELAHLGYAISMAAVATNQSMPFDESGFDREMIDTFANKQRAELLKSGKPEAAVEKIVAGSLKKFYAENAMCYQPIISTAQLSWLQVDESINISESIAQTERAFNTNISVSFYKQFVQ